MTLLYNDSCRVTINVTTGADLTGADTLELLVKKPDNTTVSWPLTVTLASAGTCYYVTDITDFEDVGDYYMQAHVTYLADTTDLYGDKIRVTIYERLELD